MSSTADPTGKFVIRRHTPVRMRVLQAAALLIGLFALYVVFEFGRYSAGFDRASVSRERAEQQRTIGALQAQLHDLHVQVAQLQTVQAGTAREREELGQELAGLQAQLDQDRQDLAVYRGVIAPASNGTSLQVQQLRITAGDGANHFIVHLTLMQGGKPDAKVSGIVGVRVSGQLNGTPASVEAVSAVPSGAVSFRYYQAVDYQVVLPEGFRAAGVQVTLHDNRADGATGTQGFPWRLDVQP
jgi:FtsP/CotA-like multicopper oxidase with cupredoxin domain